MPGMISSPSLLCPELEAVYKSHPTRQEQAAWLTAMIDRQLVRQDHPVPIATDCRQWDLDTIHRAIH